MTTTLHPALTDLYARKRLGIKPGLEAERRLLRAMGDPHVGLSVIHVGGTNGKGSVCAMLESILRAQGLRTGLYTSPHLIHFTERIRIGAVPITEEETLTLIQDVAAAEKVPGVVLGERHITFFEFVTAMAFHCFSQKKVHMAIAEVGMGGRLDATNVVMPVVSVITGIGIDHSRYLGESIEQIAREKAGIIKEGIPVVCGAFPKDAYAVIQKTARERNAPLFKVDEIVSVRRIKQDWERQRLSVETTNTDSGAMQLPLIGRHQLENCALAIAVIEVLNNRRVIRMDETTVRKGIEETRWPGRCQLISRDPVVVLDSAHNPHGAKALVDTLNEMRKGAPMGLITGFLRDKDYRAMLKQWAGSFSACWAVPLKNEAALSVEETASACRSVGLETEERSLGQAMTEAIAWARDRKGIICIAGSLFLAGEVLEREKD